MSTFVKLENVIITTIRHKAMQDGRTALVVAVMALGNFKCSFQVLREGGSLESESVWSSESGAVAEFEKWVQANEHKSVSSDSEKLLRAQVRAIWALGDYEDIAQDKFRACWKYNGKYLVPESELDRIFYDEIENLPE